MKALDQIIGYLRDRGLLGEDQLNYLIAHGYLPAPVTGAPGQDDDSSTTAAPSLAVPAADPLDELTDALPVQRRGKGGKGGAAQVQHLTVEELCARLEERLAGWGADLGPLVRIANRLRPCADWDQATQILRQAGPDDLFAALCRGVGRADPGWGPLFHAMALEEYRDLLEPEERRGPPALGYQAVLVVNHPSQLGKHAWILKHDPVRRVANLRLAQKAVLGAVREALALAPDLVARAVARCGEPLGYWSAVLVYSARRPVAWPAPHETRPYRPRPDDATWQQAWALATALDPDALPRLLLDHQREEEQLIAVDEWAAQLSQQLHQALAEARKQGGTDEANERFIAWAHLVGETAWAANVYAGWRQGQPVEAIVARRLNRLRPLLATRLALLLARLGWGSYPEDRLGAFLRRWLTEWCHLVERPAYFVPDGALDRLAATTVRLARDFFKDWNNPAYLVCPRNWEGT